MIARAWCVFPILAALAGLFVHPVRGASADGAAGSDRSGDAPLRYARVFVPVDRLSLEQCTDADVRYMPVPPEEFERLVSLAEAAAGRDGRAGAVAIVSARYAAKLEGDALVGGEARLEIVHSGDEPVLLPLAPCGLAIGRPTWDGPEEETPAQVGLAPEGGLAVLVERSGRLQLGWSLRGHCDSTDVIAFPWEAPASAASHLVLDLPQDLAPNAEEAVVVEEGPGEAGTRRWRVEIGSRRRIGLRVTPRDGAREGLPSTRLRQATQYQFSLEALDVHANLELDVHGAPLRRLAVRLDPGLRPVKALLGERPLRWALMPPGAKDEGTGVVLEFPEPVEGTKRIVHLHALAPVQLDRAWKLPAIRVQGVFWEQGTAVLSIPAPLRAERVVPLESEQSSKIAPFVAPQSGETFQLQGFSPKVTAEIVLSCPEAPLAVDSGETIELGGGEIESRLVADVWSVHGGRFELEADVAPHWSIDSVEAVPAEALADWRVERDGAKAVLRVHLSKSLPQRLPDTPPFRLTITARCPRPSLAKALGVDQLSPLRFQGVSEGRRLVCVSAREPYELKVSGDEGLKRVGVQSLESAALARFAQPPRGLLFEDDGAAAALKVSLVAQKPSYSAVIRVEAIVDQDSLTESYELRCVPEAGRRMDRVHVRFSRARKAPLRWQSVSDDDEQNWTVRREPTKESATDEISDGESWEIRLRPARSVPFEIRAVRTTPFSDGETVSLASVPEAGEQTATLVLSSSGSAAFRIEPSRLKRVSTEPVSADRPDTMRAVFRYDPKRDATPGGEAAIGIERLEADAAPASAWVWSCQLESQYPVSGMGRHVATYRLEAAGAQHLRLALPPEVGAERVRAVWLNDEQVAPRFDTEGDGRALEVELPPGRRFTTVSVCFATADRPSGVVNAVAAPLPEPNVPVLTRQWTVWAPPGFEVRDPSLRLQARAAASLGWARRLFGPLGRGPASQPYDPLSLVGWRFGGEGPQRRRFSEEKALALVRLLGELSLDAPPGAGADVLNWGTLLVDDSIRRLLAESPGGQQGPDLLVDRRALARLGLGPHTPVRAPRGETADDRGTRLLVRARLTLLAHPRAIVLTSTTAASSYRGQLEAAAEEGLGPLERRVLRAVCPGPLYDQIQEAIARETDGPFMPATFWAQRGVDSPLPWNLPASGRHGAVEPQGWTPYSLVVSGRSPARLLLVRRDALRVLCWAAFLATVGLAWWMAGDRPATLTAALGLASVAALLVPGTFAEIASGVVLGLLFVVGLRLLRRRRPEGRSGNGSGAASRGVSASASRSKLATGASLVLLAALTMMAAHGPAFGAEPGSEPVSDRSPTPRVLIPARAGDEDSPTAMEPNGDKYQVPVGLYDELQRLAARGAEEPKGWLLKGATYRGELAWQSGPDHLVPGPIKAVFDLEVLGASAEVEIPFGDEGPNLGPEGLLLDGRPPTHELVGNSVVFAVAETGAHQVEMSLRPTLESEGTHRGFRVAIPRLATSRLELAIPSDAPALDVGSAVGRVHEDRTAASSRLEAELGPSSRLSVRWLEGTTRGSSGPRVEAEELFLLEVQRGTIDLHARLKFQVGEEPVRRLALTVDPRLQRKGPYQCDAGPVVEVPVADPPDGPPTIGLEFDQPVADRQFMLEATFHLKERRTGLGALSLPRLEVKNARVTKRWLAVSIDPALEHEQAGEEALEPVAVPDFLAAWGEAPAQPGFAYSLPSVEPSWSMSTRPREPETAVDQATVWTIGAREARVELRAQLTTVAGYHFQYRLAAPPKLEIDRVSVLKGGVERADRWRRAPDGTLTVFLRWALSGEQTLSLTGRLPVPPRGTIPLPFLSLENAQVQTSSIQLFRKREVQVEIGGTTGLVRIETPVVDESQPSSARLVESFEHHGADQVGARLRLSPNRPKVAVERITSLRSDGGAWEASVEFRTRVEEGLVDQFRLRVPREFAGPYEIDAQATWELEDGDEQSRLLVRPVRAISGEYRFAVSSPLVLSPGERVRVPDIVLAEADLARHVLILPTQSGLQPIDWETEGLSRTELPEDFAAPPVAPEAFVAYQVDDGAFQASLRPFRGRPEVHLADVRLAWQTNGTCHGVATFDVEPSTLSECTLRLPPQWELMQGLVDRVPCRALRKDPNRWTIPLGVSPFPQRVEALFRGTVPIPDANGLLRLEPPKIEGIECPITLWTVFSPREYEPGRLVGLRPGTLWEHNSRRLENVEALMEVAATVPPDEPEEARPWFRLWTDRWVGLCEATMRSQQLRRGGETDAVSLAERLPLDRLPAEVSDWLESEHLLAEVGAESPEASDLGSFWRQTLNPAQPAVRSAVEPGSASIRLEYHRAEGRGFFGQLFAAAALALATLLATAGVRHGDFALLLGRWPCLLGVLVGLGWWLWLWPSVLGWAVVLVSLIASFRWGWKRPRQTGSAVIALTLPQG